MKLEDVIPIDHLDDVQYKIFMSNRGGCTCFISPPCSACVEPLTKDELEVVGFLVDDEGFTADLNTSDFVKGSEYKPDEIRSDVMDITRRMFG